VGGVGRLLVKLRSKILFQEVFTLWVDTLWWDTRAQACYGMLIGDILMLLSLAPTASLDPSSVSSSLSSSSLSVVSSLECSQAGCDITVMADLQSLSGIH